MDLIVTYAVSCCRNENPQWRSLLPLGLKISNKLCKFNEQSNNIHVLVDSLLHSIFHVSIVPKRIANKNNEYKKKKISSKSMDF